MSANPKIKIQVDGEEREIFMSFALLNKLLRLVGPQENIPLIAISAELSEAVLYEVLAKRSATGKVLEQKPVEEIAITLDDVQDVLEFVSEQLLDFTVAALTKAAAQKGKVQERLSSLLVSLTGPANSSLTTPAA